MPKVTTIPASRSLHTQRASVSKATRRVAGYARVSTDMEEQAGSYADYLSGHSPAKIARELTSEGIPTPRGKTKWTTTTIRSILANEKYKGDALLQKTLTTDFPTKKTKINEGEVPQYYVSGNHEAIIDPVVWEQVQTETERRKHPSVRTEHPFAARIRCAQCGGWFGRKTWHSTSKYARHIWRCNNKYEGNKTGCTTPHIYEAQI